MRNDRGAAAVEMAFTVLLLLWLALGIIDIGRAIFTNIALQDAAQTGAAYGAFTETATTPDVESAVITSSDSLNLTADDIDVACQTVTRDDKDGSQVRVTVRLELQMITPLVGQAFGTIDLERTSEAERFFDSCNDLQEVPW